MENKRICFYFNPYPEKDRWIKYDRYVRMIIRRIVRGKPYTSGIDKVFVNLKKGLDLLQVPYVVNVPFHRLTPNDQILFMGRGPTWLEKYIKSGKKYPFAAAIGFSSHPIEIKDIMEGQPLIAYFSHCSWVNDIYAGYFGKDTCLTWPAGVDTEAYPILPLEHKTTDFLIYRKIRWNVEAETNRIVEPIRQVLQKKGFTWKEIVYLSYKPEQLKELQRTCKALIFVTEHETQGFALQECMSTGMPVLAWNEGIVRDPYYGQCGTLNPPVTAVPFFDETCGRTFTTVESFENTLDLFWEEFQQNKYNPAQFIRYNFTLQKSAEIMCEKLNTVYNKQRL